MDVKSLIKYIEDASCGDSQGQNLWMFELCPQQVPDDYYME